jgi:hypothetical protein
MRCGSIRDPRTPPIGDDLSNVGTSHGSGAVRCRIDKTGACVAGPLNVQLRRPAVRYDRRASMQALVECPSRHRYLQSGRGESLSGAHAIFQTERRSMASFRGVREKTCWQPARLKATTSRMFFDRARVPLHSPFPHRLEDHVKHRDDEDAD